MALATTASHDTEFAGLQILLKMFAARCNSTSSMHLQTQAEQPSPGQVGYAAAPTPWTKSMLMCVNSKQEGLQVFLRSYQCSG